MKVILATLGSEDIAGLDDAFSTQVLIERVGGDSPETVIADIQQLIETWVPDLLVVAESYPRHQGEKLQSTLVMDALRRGKLLKQPAIYVGHFLDSQAIEILSSGMQALVPVSMNLTTHTYSVNSDYLRAQAFNLANLVKGQATKNFKLGAFTVLPDAGQVYCFDTLVPFTKSEAGVFTQLVQAKGAIVTKEMIYSNLYSMDNEVEFKIIDVFICKVRNKLTRVLDALGYEGGGVIGTVWGRGYQINLAKVPGLGEIGHQEFLASLQQTSKDLLQITASASANGASVSGNGKALVRHETKANHDSSVLTQIRDHLLAADFKERDADIRAYVGLARQAINDGHSVQELYGLFGGCFEPLWDRGSKLDAKTFGFHLANPDRLRFYRINTQTLGAVAAFSNGQVVGEVPTKPTALLIESANPSIDRAPA